MEVETPISDVLYIGMSTSPETCSLRRDGLRCHAIGPTAVILSHAEEYECDM